MPCLNDCGGRLHKMQTSCTVFFKSLRTQPVTLIVMIGARIRQIRQGQRRSLADVAQKAKVSVATLSRIENDKQTLDLRLFLTIAKVLECAPAELLGELEGEADRIDQLVQKIAAFQTDERMRLWRDLANVRRTVDARYTRNHVSYLAEHVEELLAQVDFMRAELDSVRQRLRRRTSSR